MFELEKSILEWKLAFQKRCSVDEASIEELESHLRESVAELSRKGLSEEEGFIVAMKRLGNAPALDAEFQKNSPLGVNQERLIWMFSGYLGITLCGILSTAIISSLATGMLYAGWASSLTGFVATLIEILFWIGVFFLAVRESQFTFMIGKHPLLSLLAMFILMVTLPIVSQFLFEHGAGKCRGPGVAGRYIHLDWSRALRGTVAYLRILLHRVVQSAPFQIQARNIAVRHEQAKQQSDFDQQVS